MNLVLYDAKDDLLYKGDKCLRIRERFFQHVFIVDIVPNALGKYEFILDVYSKGFEPKFYINRITLSVRYSDKLYKL